MGLQDPGVLQDSKVWFHEPSAFAKEYCYYVPYAGDFHCNENYLVARESLDTCLLMLVDYGTLELESDKQECVLGAGMVALLDGTKSHRYYSKGELKMRWFHFTGSGSSGYVPLINERFGLALDTTVFSNSEKIIEEILVSLRSGTVDEHQMSVKIHKLLSVFVNTPEMEKSATDLGIEKSIEFMELHYSRQLYLDEIAQSASLSPYYFLRQFKKVTNSTPHEYLLRIRILHGKELLRRTELSVEEIADQCGFSSSSHFIRCFKQLVLMTPHQFRKLRF